MHELSLEQCYALLGLQSGASIEEIDAAFAKKSLEKLRQGAKAEKQLLKVAYDRLREHSLLKLQHIAEAERYEESSQHQITEFLRDRLAAKQIQVQVRIKAQTAQIFLQANPAPTANLAGWIEQNLRSIDLSDIQTIDLYGLHANRSIAWKKQFQLNQTRITLADCDPYASNNRIITTTAFPIMMGIAVLTNAGFLSMPFLPMRIWIHEFGHATMAWLAGRHATPLPWGWTNVGEARSLFVYFGILVLLGLLGWTGWKERKPWSIGIAIGLGVMQFFMTWILPTETYEMWLAFGGIGGEFYLSTLLMVSFYFRFPEYWRWDFWRYVVSIVAAHTFWSTFTRWHNIRVGQEDIPWGSMLFGDGDAGGDMNQLSAGYGWSDSQIINTYNGLGTFCLFVLFSLYCFFLLKNRRWILSVLSRQQTS